MSDDSRDFVSSRGYQPTCFAKEVFQSENFKVDSFINDCKRRVTLDTVLVDLKEYASYLDTELVELINKDYTDFVSLSSNLVGIDKVINDLRTPFQHIKQEVSVRFDNYIIYITDIILSRN